VAVTFFSAGELVWMKNQHEFYLEEFRTKVVLFQEAV